MKKFPDNIHFINKNPGHLLILVILILGGCTKYEDVIVPDNIAPPDPTISNTTYENYVNRTYILVLGREPLSAELTDAVIDLKKGNLDMASRLTFLNQVFADVNYRSHLYEDNRFNLLRDNDSADFKFFIGLLQMSLADITKMQAWPVYQYELNRLNKLDSAKQEFENGSIDIKEVQRRMVNNYFYDQINMNAQNFVLAVFQQLINRSPTQNELQNSVAMVDNYNSVLFAQAGSSKEDFLSIVLNSDDFYEGQVVQLYNKFLLRLPTSQQMTSGMLIYRDTGSYIEAQIEILKSDKFSMQ